MPNQVIKPYPLKDFGNLSIVIYPSKAKIWQHRFSIKVDGKRKEKNRRAGVYPSMSIKEARAWRDNNNELLALRNYSSKEIRSNQSSKFQHTFIQRHV